VSIRISANHVAMRRLSRSDLEGVLVFVRELNEVDGRVPLTTELLDRLTELVGCTYASYEEYDWRRRIVTAYVRCSNEDPQAVPPPYVSEDFWTADDWPYRTGPAAFEKLSDRLDRRERERIRDEEEFNAEFRIVDAIGLRAGDGRTQSAFLHFDSPDRDFDERDRELTLALRPHVEALWRKAVSRRQHDELLALVGRDGDPADGRAIVLHAGGGRIDHATAEARRLLAGWFGTRNGRLPHEVAEWVAGAAPGDRYSEHRNGSVLTVEAIGSHTLTLREHLVADASITPREREVLELIAAGLRNDEVARRLWIAPSTVAKHLEHVYRKLGVTSRTAALARLRAVSDFDRSSAAEQPERQAAQPGAASRDAFVPLA
jgi:DNA-binding CsgD family transcriptional regulator